MRLFQSAAALVLIATVIPSVFAKEHLLKYDEDVFIYELRFDDTRIPLSQMRELACLSPWLGTYCAPFLIGIDSKLSGKTEIVQKSFMAPELELCLAGKGRPCDRNPEIPDAAFLRNASLNLSDGAKQVEILRNRQVPPVLASIKATLLATLENSLAKQQARYEYLKSGDLTPMRAIICRECNCGVKESALLEQLRSATDPRVRLRLAWYDWHNAVLACERSHHPAPYPLDQWNQFLKQYGIVEKRRTIQID